MELLKALELTYSSPSGLLRVVELKWGLDCHVWSGIHHVQAEHDNLEMWNLPTMFLKNNFKQYMCSLGAIHL